MNNNVSSKDYEKILDAHSRLENITTLPINYANITIPQLENILDKSRNKYIERPNASSPYSKNLLANMREFMKQLYKKDPSKFVQYANNVIETAIQDIQLAQAQAQAQAQNRNSMSASAAGGGGSNPPFVAGQAFENQLTSLVTNPESLVKQKILNYNRLNYDELNPLSLGELKELKQNAERSLENAIRNSYGRKKENTAFDSLEQIKRAMRNIPRVKGQTGGSNNKTSKNRRQRFNIRLV